MVSKKRFTSTLIHNLSVIPFGKNAKNTTLALLEALIETGPLRGKARVHALYNISNKLDLLKVLMRLAKDTRTIDNKQFSFWILESFFSSS